MSLPIFRGLGYNVGSQFFILRMDAATVRPDYLAWFLRSDVAIRHFHEHRRGSYVQIIDRRTVESLDVPLPPLKIQATIAHIAELGVCERKLAIRLAELQEACLSERLRRRAEHLAQEPVFHKE
ncbi:MAG: hypothetical protein HY360_03360 [Verrucomicrobia bacterium]|nr:hypothetical protein [Verrucomicrobiota bacterium]